jgi:hypothetical protein
VDNENKKTSVIDQIKQLVGPEGLRTEVNITLTTETLFKLYNWYDYIDFSIVYDYYPYKEINRG